MSYYTYPAGVVSILILLWATFAPVAAPMLAGLYVCALLIVLSCAGALFLSLFGAYITDGISARAGARAVSGDDAATREGR